MSKSRSCRGEATGPAAAGEREVDGDRDGAHTPFQSGRAIVAIGTAMQDDAASTPRSTWLLRSRSRTNGVQRARGES
jgi:hypothetical protein